MRLLKITTLCLFILFIARYYGGPGMDENEMINIHSKLRNYKKTIGYYLKTGNIDIKIGEDEKKAFAAAEKQGKFLYNDVRLDENTVISFLGCSKNIKFRIGILNLRTGVFEHVLTDVYLDKANTERLISLDAQNNPYVLMSVYPKGGARGVLYWSIIDINEKKEIFVHPQKIRNFEEPVIYTLDISGEYFNNMRVINIYDGNKAPVDVFKWDPLKKEYTDKPDEAPTPE